MARLIASLWLVAAWLVALPPAWAQERGMGERRVALVIGNASYKSSPLANPVNDSRDVAKALRALRFEVIERQDLNREGFAVVVREFGDRLRGASVGLFYFAGHGLQVRGRNFLVPVDADIAREDEVAYRSFDVNEVLDKMDSARTAVNLVLLDACRNNPFARSFKSTQVGLAQMDAPAGTLISFATAPGSVAQDGEGTANGVYTGALLKHLPTPGLAVEQMFKRVRTDVASATRNTQVPWESSSMNRDFSFADLPMAVGAPVTPTTTAAAAANATELSLELAFWDAIKDTRNPADYLAYLEQYPKGRFATLARVRSGSTTSVTPPVVAATHVAVPALAPGSNVVRWKQGSSERSFEIRGAGPVTAQATSPEGLYLAAVAGGTVHWIDAVRAVAVRSTRVFDEAGAVASAAQFSPDGRWLLLRVQRGQESSQTLVNVASGQVAWDKSAVQARFDANMPVLHLQGSRGDAEIVRLP